MQMAPFQIHIHENLEIMHGLYQYALAANKMAIQNWMCIRRKILCSISSDFRFK